MKFSEAFKKARKELGAGKTFTWNGKSYSTNLKEEGSGKKSAGEKYRGNPTSTAPTSSSKPKARTSPVEAAASRAIDRASRVSGASRSTAGKTSGSSSTPSSNSNAVSGASRSTSGKVWERMSRSERAAAGRPVSRAGRAIERLTAPRSAGRPRGRAGGRSR